MTAQQSPASTGRSWLSFLPIAAFLALAALFLVRLFAGDASRVPSALIGRPVPAFDLPALPGLGVPGLSAADLRGGGVTLVNVFASWCVPCHEEHAQLLALKDKGVRIVGIAYKDEPENSRRFLGRDGNPYARVGMDRSGRTGIDFGVYGVPETFVVRGDGTVAYKFVGPITPEATQADVLPQIEKASR